MNCTFRELFNLLRVMKIVILFMLIGLTHLSAEVRSQNASVSLKLKDATIEQVILEVEKQLKQDFFFSKKGGGCDKKDFRESEPSNAGRVGTSDFRRKFRLPLG